MKAARLLLSGGLLLALALASLAGLPKLPAVPKAPAAPKLAASSAGAADPKLWLGRADELVTQLDGATACLESGRAALFSLAATAEEKKLLTDLQVDSDTAAGDVVVKQRQYQAEVVEQARQERRFAAKQLNADQARNMGRLGSNLLLAIRRDQVAAEAGKKLVGDADDVLKAAQDPQQALRLGKDAGRVAGMPARLQESLGRVPGQLEALNALLQAVEQTRANNQVELQPAPASGGSYEQIEDF